MVLKTQAPFSLSAGKVTSLLDDAALLWVPGGPQNSSKS